MGINMETIPTSQPAKIQPTANRGRAAAMTCMETSAAKVRTPRMTDQHLPRKSAVGVVNKVPKNVPADEMETTRDCWDEVMAHTPVAGLGFPKTYNRSSMVWIPEITPVS